MKDIWAEFRPNIFTWQELVLSVSVDTNHAEAQFSHILSNRAFMFIDYHGLCVVWAFPWTEATCPTAHYFSNCQRFAMNGKFQVQTHYIANSMSTKWKKNLKLFQLPFMFAMIMTFLSWVSKFTLRDQYIYI